MSEENQTLPSEPNAPAVVKYRSRKMDKALKAKWIAALRSGKYQQTTWRLRRGKKSFCCLGVLCEVAGIKIDQSGALPEGKGDYAPIWRLLPKRAEALPMMNDSGAKFPEIADFIEANL